MPLIIDTYNVLHTVGVLPPEIAGIDTRGLIDLIRASRFRQLRTTLVCDGAPDEGAPQGQFGPVTVRYAGVGGAKTIADDVIAAMIQRSSIPRKLTIVSSDRAVLREARRRRCATMSSSEFLALLAEDHEVPKPRERSTPPPGAAGASLSPLASILPPELIEAAEALAEEGLAEEAVPGSASEPEVQGSEQEEPRETKPAEPSREETYRRVLPPSLIDQAEALLSPDLSTVPTEEEPETDGGALPPATDEPGDRDLSGLGPLADLPLGGDLLPDDILAEAESMLEDESPEDEQDR